MLTLFGRLSVVVLWLFPVWAGGAEARDADPLDWSTALRAELRTERPIVQSGRPVWVEFALVNLTDHTLVLAVPQGGTAGTGAGRYGVDAGQAGATATRRDSGPAGERPTPRDDGLAGETPPPQEAGRYALDQGVGVEMGLPLAHVFSGENYTALSIRDSRGDMFDQTVAVKPRSEIPVVILAPYASVGLRVDLTRHYDSLLRRAGRYTLVWRPYQGALESAPLEITLLAERQAIIMTRFGNLTMRFYYDEAPLHVQNFIELIEQRFYDELTFHKVVPGGLIQGGDPLGDGRGVRPDGKRVPAEFSRIPFELGTVGMARLPRDPDSASCQFFICLGRQPSFDGQQTAFGYLVGEHSFETLRQIAAVPTGPRDRPLRPVYIQAISLENVPTREREMILADPGSRRAAPAGRAPEEAGGPSALRDDSAVQNPQATTRPSPDEEW